MFKFAKLALALSAVSAIAFAPAALAAGEGQIEGGNIYRIKNVTKNVDFTDPANADSCDVLMYKVRIHDPGPVFLTDVRIKATLDNNVANSHVSTLTASAINASPATTTDTATLNLSSSQSIAYVNGSTQLLDANGNAIKTLPDGITQAGIGIGNVGVSINEKRFVQFQVKVNCPTETQTTTPTTTPQVSKTLPNTGAGEVVGLFSGASAVGAAVHMAVSRRNRR
jgi:hypothetical protein